MPNFKVIVIGGGPVGLTAAHALSKAGIDFVVLERRPQVFEDVGASLVLSPANLRVMSQFGLLPKLRELGTEVLRWADYTQDGGLYGESFHAYYIKRNHGSCSFMFHRANLVQAIYEGLSEADQARVHTSKNVANIESTSDGVTVTCADGSTYEGSIVLGADGVHSPTRKIMREVLLKTSPNPADVDAEEPFSIQYKTMWCSFPRRYEYTPGEHCLTHGTTSSAQFLCAEDRCWIFLYEKLDQPTQERTSFTEADMVAFAEKHGDVLIGGQLRVRDFFPHRTSGGMANLEEGVLKQWSGGRIALAGDACHKFTPNAGLGLNNGIQDVVVLVNELHRCLESVGQGAAPGQDEVAAVFKRYQTEREPLVQSDYNMSAHTTRLHAWPSAGYWLFDQYIMPMIPRIHYLMAYFLMGPAVSKSWCLDFVEGEEPFKGNVPWVHPMKQIAQVA